MEQNPSARSPKDPPAGQTAEPQPSRPRPDVGRPVQPYWNANRFLVVVGLVLGLLIPGLFFGVPAYLFLGPIILPSVVALGLILWRQQAWSYLTAGILGALYPLFVFVMLGLLEGGLADPLNAGEFSAILLILGSLALVLAGAIPGFRHARAQRPHGQVGRLWSAPQGVFALFVVALVVGAAGVSQLAGSRAAGIVGGGYDFTPPASTSVIIDAFEFVPRDITVTQGVITEIRVENRDSDFHTFTYERDGVEYNHDLYGGATVGFLVLFDQPGTYAYWCAPHSRGADDPGDGMVGTLTVVASD